MVVSMFPLLASDLSGDLTDGRGGVKEEAHEHFELWKVEVETPTCQVFGPDQHQHAAQDVEAQRGAAEDAALTFGRRRRRQQKRRNVAALIFNHTGKHSGFNRLKLGFSHSDCRPRTHHGCFYVSRKGLWE